MTLTRRQVAPLLTALGLTMAVARTGFAQSSKQLTPKRLGVLIPFAESDVEARRNLDLFQAALGRLGWAKGVGFSTDIVYAPGGPTVLEPAAVDLVARRPDAILVRSTAATRALLKATKTIPVVFVVVSDPVGDGFVASLARPDGHVTGFTNVSASFAGKWLDLLKAVQPALSRVAVISGAGAGTGGDLNATQVSAAATRLGLTLVDVSIKQADDISSLIGPFSGQPGIGAVVLPDARTVALRRPIVAAMASTRIPAVYPLREFAEAGGLISYGTDIGDLHRRAADYVDRVLRGADPGQLPVQAPTKFDLVINTRVARDLGLNLSPTLLASADDLIE